MLAQGRKGHFVYDVLDALSRTGGMPEEQRRMFVEMLFTRGARMGTEAAQNFLAEKVDDKTITVDEARAIDRLMEKYSFYR